MAKTDFSRDAVIILSYLRTGASLEDAFIAMAYTVKSAKEFKEQYETEIAQAQAQCRILCLHNIFTEGGKSGAEFVLRYQEKHSGQIENPDAEHGGLVFDDLDLGDFDI